MLINSTFHLIKFPQLFSKQIFLISSFHQHSNENGGSVKWIFHFSIDMQIVFLFSPFSSLKSAINCECVWFPEKTIFLAFVAPLTTFPDVKNGRMKMLLVSLSQRHSNALFVFIISPLFKSWKVRECESFRKLIFQEKIYSRMSSRTFPKFSSFLFTLSLRIINNKIILHKNEDGIRSKETRKLAISSAS